MRPGGTTLRGVTGSPTDACIGPIKYTGQESIKTALALFKDALKNDGGTEFVVSSVEFNAKIPESVFSQASLRK